MRKKPLVALLGGLAIGGLAIGIAILILIRIAQGGKITLRSLRPWSEITENS